MNPFRSYAKKTLRSLCASLVPETPQLARRLGEEHRPGAESVNLEEQLFDAFNNLTEVDLGPLDPSADLSTAPLSYGVALLLDLTAVEYILLCRPNDAVNPSVTGGPFSWLSEADRRSLLDYLAEESAVSKLNSFLATVSPYSGLFKFLVRGITSVPLITYYSEWDGYRQDGGKLLPDPDTFSGDVQSWQQTGFPGLKDEYPVLRGYEVEEFEENDY